MVALYAEDGVLMAPHAPVATGHDQIRAFLTADMAGAKAAGVKIVPGAATAGVAGDTGWESGSFTVADASGATVDSGSYMSVSREDLRVWQAAKRGVHVSWLRGDGVSQARTKDQERRTKDQ